MSRFKRACSSYAKESNWLSQNEREMIQRERYAQDTLKTISLAERHDLFKDLRTKKGKNTSGGVYGQKNSDVTMKRTSKSFFSADTHLKAASYSQTITGRVGYGTQVQDPVLSKQPYQHDQKCPIIVRGHLNVDPNHLAIRNINGNLNNETLIPTWKCHMVKNLLHKY